MQSLELFYDHYGMGWAFDFPDHPFVADGEDLEYCMRCSENASDHPDWPDTVVRIREQLRTMADELI